MQINQVIENENGSVKFSGELSGAELQFVVEVGLNFLMQQGALPFALVEEDASFVPGNGELN